MKIHRQKYIYTVKENAKKSHHFKTAVFTIYLFFTSILNF